MENNWDALRESAPKLKISEKVENEGWYECEHCGAEYASYNRVCPHCNAEKRWEYHDALSADETEKMIECLKNAGL